MALDYGKMEFAVSFKPITAFPLDSRSYYESLAAAEAAAATAVEAGSDQGTIYFGQTLVVVENGAAQMLQVQPDGTLSEIGGKIEIDEHQFTIDKTTGKLNLFGFADAVAGAQPVIEEVEVEGVKVKQLKWVKPDTTTVEGLATAVADLETAQAALDTRVSAVETAVGAPAGEGTVASGLYAEVDKKANAADVYTKTETDALLDNKANSVDVYTKAETDTAIATAVSAADHLKRVILSAPTSDQTVEDVINKYLEDNQLTAVADQYIFMIPTGLSYDSNKYYEYIVITEGETSYVEQVGNWEVDLSDYVSETELADYLTSYYTSARVDEILAAYATTATLETELEKYYTIEQLDTLLAGYYNKDDIDGLLADIYSKAEVDNKFVGYYTKTETDNLLNNKVDKVDGKSLVSDTEIAKLATVKENAEPNYIKTVSSNFNVTESGQLNLNTLEVENINGLKATLDEKVDKVYYTVPVVDENGDPVFEEDGVTPKTEQVEGALLSPEDKEKLDALVIGEEGVEISGKVNASNVEGLSEWITSNRNTVTGLYSTTTESKLTKAISDLEALTATVETNTNGITAVNTRVDDVITSLTAYVQYTEYNAKMAEIDTDIDMLKDALTWKPISTTE